MYGSIHTSRSGLAEVMIGHEMDIRDLTFCADCFDVAIDKGRKENAVVLLHTPDTCTQERWMR